MHGAPPLVGASGALTPGRAAPSGRFGFFDRLSMDLATRISRRTVLRGFFAALGGLLTYGIVGCEGQPDPGACPVPCDGECCDPGLVCVGGGCVAPDEGISGQIGSTRFWARAEGDGRSEARYSVAGSDDLLVFVRDEDHAELVWRGVAISGRGPLSSVQEAALRDLTEGPYRRAIVRAPLELACAFGDIAPSVYAALVFPWQLMLKYLIEDREAHMQMALDDASCAYLPTLEQLATNHPRPAFPIVSWTLPFPYAFGFLPFDAEGTLEVSPAARSDGRDPLIAGPESVTSAGVAERDPIHFARFAPTGEVGRRSACPFYTELRVGQFGPTGSSQCRQACGVDCPETCCQEDEWTCVVGSNGRYTGQAMLTRTYVCGVHKGCIDHDDCYDVCVSKFGDCLNVLGDPSWACYHWDNFWCHRACDRQAVSEHGLKKTLQWKSGYGEISHNVAYRYDLGLQTSPGTDAPLCPPGQCAPAGARRMSTEEPPDDDECVS
jgi:hypothetical protein